MTDSTQRPDPSPADRAPSSVLISVDALQEQLSRESATVVLDVRWTLAVPDGRQAYLAGHLPGAVYVDLDAELAGHGEPTDGRHPLPEVSALQESARGWGLNDGDPVVVYDDSGNQAAARAWWLLRYAGLTDVRLLDGALSAWVAAGQPIESGPVDPVPGTVSLAYGHLPVTTIDDVAGFGDTRRLLDVRAAERYRGEAEPIDPQAGHIPGALNAPTGDNLGLDGRFLAAAELLGRYAALGLEPGSEVAVYCGSGVTASHAAAALTLAGYTPILYPGSWSQWSNHPDRPVATGPSAAGSPDARPASTGPTITGPAANTPDQFQEAHP